MGNLRSATSKIGAAVWLTGETLWGQRNIRLHVFLLKIDHFLSKFPIEIHGVECLYQEQASETLRQAPARALRLRTCQLCAARRGVAFL